MSDSNIGSKGWWQTLPGMLTAVAAIITALTGLMVALGGLGVFHTNPRPQKHAEMPSAQDASSSSGGGASDAGAGHRANTAGTRNLPLPATTQVRSGSAVYKLLSLESAPYSQDKTSLRFSVRMINDGSAPSNFWSASFRLRVDDSLQTPINLLNELVDSNSSKDGTVEFVVPADTRNVGFQMGDVGIDKPDIRISLSSTGTPAPQSPEPRSDKN